MQLPDRAVRRFVESRALVEIRCTACPATADVFECEPHAGSIVVLQPNQIIHVR
jgi:hypothetical protein